MFKGRPDALCQHFLKCAVKSWQRFFFIGCIRQFHDDTLLPRLYNYSCTLCRVCVVHLDTEKGLV